MTTETINGLHRCQPKNEPQQGQVKTFLVVHNPAKQGKKAWIAIKSAPEDKGGTPYKVVSVESTGWEPDQYGNQSYNLEVEAVNGQQGTKQGETFRDPEHPANQPEFRPSRSNGGDGVTEARKHLMQSSNLLNLCVAAVDKAIAPNVPKIAQTSEFFQAQVATLFIEASRAGFVDSMPTVPIEITKPAPNPEPDEEPPF